MRTSKYASAALALLITASAQAQHKYDTWEENYTVQALLGAIRYKDLEVQDSSGNGDPITMDIATIPQLGGAWTTLPQEDDRFQYGLECSFLLGFRFDSVSGYFGSGGTYIKLSTSMWMFDLAGGAYANLFLDNGRKVRLYAGTGPLMAFANYRSERTDSSGTSDDSESAFGLGLYARTGVEFRIHEYGMLGLGVRGTWSSVDLSEFSGSSDLVGTAVFATYTAGF